MPSILNSDDGVVSGTSGLKTTGGNDGITTFQQNGTERMRIDSSGNVGIGTTSPSFAVDVVRSSGDAQLRLMSQATGTNGIIFRNNAAPTSGKGAILYPNGSSASGADTMQFVVDNAERMRIDSSGNVGIGTTSPDYRLEIEGPGTGVTSRIGITNTTTGSTLAVGSDGNGGFIATSGAYGTLFYTNGTERARITSGGDLCVGTTATAGSSRAIISGNTRQLALSDGTYNWYQVIGNNFWSIQSGEGTERARITSAGEFLVGKTSDTGNGAGITLGAAGYIRAVRSNEIPVTINRTSSDGTLVSFEQDTVAEGSISVSGTTVSYNGGHLSRWAQTQGPKDDTLVKGTVLSNLDEMNVYVVPTTYWTEEDELPEGVNVGDVKVETHTVDNEQLNKVKVSDVEGDVNVAGVFVNWSYDEQHQVDEINMAMTGDMIIRIAQGVVVQKGDLLMSAGDGTAKPQGDDIVRSKTVAKVTSNHVTCTYADGSYCVPCVLMAC